MPDHDLSEPANDDDEACTTHTIHEESEPPSPEGKPPAPAPADDDEAGPSVLSNLLKRSPPQSVVPDAPKTEPVEPRRRTGSSSPAAVTEETPLLAASPRVVYDHAADVEGQKTLLKKAWFGGLSARGRRFRGHAAYAVAVASNPRRWDTRLLWQNVVVEPVSCLPAVTVGLLLNVLDALSYGRRP